MDWFRWHHGSVNDPKFQLVAKKADASVAEVIAVWACLLEAASAANDRGNPGDPDFDSMDCALGFDDGKARRIYERMNDRALVSEDGRIVAWDRRQPKRERDDDNSTERSRTHRAKQRHATPSNASDDTGTPRGDKRREEEKDRDSEANASGAVAPAKAALSHDEIIFGYGVPLLVNAGAAEKHARSFLGGIRKEHGDAALVDKLRECLKAKPLQPMDWLAAALPPKGGPPKAAPLSFKERETKAKEARFREMAGSAFAMVPGINKSGDFIDMEVGNANLIGNS